MLEQPSRETSREEDSEKSCPIKKMGTDLNKGFEYENKKMELQEAYAKYKENLKLGNYVTQLYYYHEYRNLAVQLAELRGEI